MCKKAKMGDHYIAEHHGLTVPPRWAGAPRTARMASCNDIEYHEWRVIYDKDREDYRL